MGNRTKTSKTISKFSTSIKDLISVLKRQTALAYRHDVPVFPRRDAVAHQGRRAQGDARGGQGAALGEALDHHPRHHHEDIQVGRHREEEDQAILRTEEHTATSCSWQWSQW